VTNIQNPPAAPLPEQGGQSLADAERQKAYIAGVQRDLNRHLSVLGAPTRLAIDGVWDDATQAAFQDVCRVLGVAPARDVRTYRLIAGAVAAPTEEEQRKRSTDGVAFEAELRARFAQQRVVPTNGVVGGVPLSPEDAQRAYVATLQRDLNSHLRRLKTGTELPIDGVWDAHTEHAFQHVCQALGIAPERTTRTFRMIAGAIVTQVAKPRRGTAKVVVRGRSLPKDERDRAYIAFLQRALNDHLLRLESPYLLGVDGKWGEHTERAFKRICRLLGVEPARDMRTYRIVAGALATRTDEEAKRASVDGADYEKRLRELFAKQRQTVPQRPPRPTPKPEKPHKPEKPAGEDRIAALIRRHGGRYEDEIIAASRATKVPVALLCAMIETETGFQNVFGGDNVPNPIKSRGRPYLKVTKPLYQEYLRNRKKGLGQQGVGPMQLTTASYQDRADKLGGCWKPGPNIMVGAQVLVEKTRAVGGGVRNGVKAYNSWSPAGDDYADKLVMPRYAKWKERLGGSAGPAPSGARVLKLTNPEMRGEDVKRFQRAINARLAAWRVAKRLDTDGRYGPDTANTARDVARGLGIPMAEFKNGFGPRVRSMIIDPDKRTPEMKARSKTRRQYRARLRKEYATPPVKNLLRGFPAPHSKYLLRAIARAHKLGLVVTSTTGDKHAKTSWHYQGLAVDFGIVPGSMSLEEKTRRLIRFQRDLAKDGPRLLELFGPDKKAVIKNGRPAVMSPAIEADHRDHVHLAARD
jgi:tellurite resistance protein